MSVIEKMSIMGVRSFGTEDHDKQVIEFFNPLTLILGPNGTGKTTIIECLRYITTGDMPPGSKGGAFIHDPKIAREQRVNAQVRLQFRDILNMSCIVQRSLEATQKLKKIETRTLDGVITRLGPDGHKQSITSRCAEIDQEMINSLGVSKSVLENVIFCHQEDSNWPLSEGKALKEKFDAIFASTRYVKALENIRKIKLEQDQAVKGYRTEIMYLRQNQDSAARLENDLHETEAKFAASKESVQKLKLDILPIEEKLDKIYSKASDVNQLNSKIGKMTGEKEMLVKNMRELEENIKNQFVGSDGELRDCLDDFQGKVKEREDMVKQFEDRKSGLQKKLDKLNMERSSVDVDVGKREQEAEANQENTRLRDALLRQMASEHDIPGFSSGEMSRERVDAFTHHATDLVTEMNTNIRAIKTEYDEREAEVQNRMDAVRERKTRLEQDMRNKQETLSKNKCEMRDISQKLSKMTASGERKQQIERETKGAEMELHTVRSAVNVDQLKTEIDSMQTEKRGLDTKLSSLNSEMSRIHMQSSLQTELNLLRKQKSEKEDAVRRMKARHEDSLKHILGEIPSENIRGKLDDCLIKLSDEVKRGEKDLQMNQMDQSRYEANRKMLVEQLKTKEREVKGMEEKIYDTCGSQRFDEGLVLLQQKMGASQNLRGSLLGAEHFFRKYVNDLKRDDPCCPLCHREFEASQEVRELIAELEGKLRLVPGKLDQSERDLTDHQSKYDAMLQLKPLKENIVSLEDSDIPNLKQKVAETSARIEELKLSIQSKSDALRIQKNDEATATSIKPDVILMERSLGEVRDLDRKIAGQSGRLIGGDSGRTLEQVNEEKEDTQLILETVNHQLEHKRDKLRNHGDRVQSLKDRVNELTAERLQVENDLQQRTKLEETKEALGRANENLDDAIREIKEDLLPLQGDVQSLETEKRQVTSDKEMKMEEAKLEVDAVVMKAADISSYHKKILSYTHAGGAAQLTACQSRQRKIQEETEEVAGDHNEVTNNLEKLREELSKQQVRERELDDNLKLREKEKHVKKLEERISRVKEDIGGLDPVGLEREKNLLENKRDELKNQWMKAEGRQRGYQDEMRRLEGELKTDQYSGATDRYKEKIITMKTTVMASDDLGKYYKVLDRAIMDYHSMKMDEINKIIRDLWRKTYRGNDIETIEIRSDEDDQGVIKTRRVYHYRVVMVRGDIGMDMRGRCSAGQKVLASLIIRLALAETFCLNCGILALDEPTTNLDRENIESLAFALVEIIKSRSHQRNFRLIVITHDEDFLELLGRSDYVEEFFKIRKNQYGCSQIIRSRVSDLHLR